MAVANSNVAICSTDGITWTGSTMPTPTTANWYSVTYGNGKFVAISNGYDYVAYSTDGVTWTATTLPSSDRWVAVTYGNGVFVAICELSSKAAYSTDGITWTQTALPSSAKWSSVTYGNDKFVAIAQNSNEVAYSTDGITWLYKWRDLYFKSDRDKIDVYINRIAELEESWAGTLTFTGNYTGSNYVTQADSFIAVDKISGRAFITIRGGNSTSYENIYFNSSMTLPEGVTALTTQTYGGPNSGASRRYFTQVLTGITGKINVTANMNAMNSNYDYVQCTLTVTYA